MLEQHLIMSYISWNHFDAKSTWHESQDFYGNAIKISRSKIIGSLVILCLVTPFTNWLIPILPKLIRTGMNIRWG